MDTSASFQNPTTTDNTVIGTDSDFDKHDPYTFDPSAYKIYKRRWFLLFVIVVVNLTNAFIWIMFSPITEKVSDYYKISFMDVNWLSLVYLVASIPTGIFASWVLDSMGLRASIIAAAWLNFIGSALRNLTIFDFIPLNIRFPVLITGQTVAALGQTFIMFTPAKVAALWFGDNQRTIATTVASMSNPLGILIANILSPALVKQSSDLPIMVQDLFMLIIRECHFPQLWLCSAASLLGVLLSTLGVCASLPPSPPSPSAASQSEPFFVGIKKLRKNTAFWILTFSVGGGLALFTSFTTFMEQILCPQDYNNSYAGLCGALLIGVGCLGAFIAGIIVDKTKKFAEVMKIGFALSTLCAITFVQLARYQDLEVPVALSVALFGMFGCAIYPVSLEMAVEVTYPVAEATSTGIIFLSGQIQGIALMLVSQYTAQPLSAHAQTLPQACQHNGEFDPQDWTVPNLIVNGMGVIYTIVIVLLFKASYRRMQAEERIKIVNTLQRNTPSVIA